MQRTHIVMNMEASNPTRSTIITRIRTDTSLRGIKVSIQKGTTTHPIMTVTMKVAVTLMMMVNQIRYSL